MKVEEKYDVIEALEALGIQRISERGNEITFSCPQDFHSRGDRNPSASVNKESLAYHCFSCGSSGNLYTLIADIEGIPVSSAIKWLRQKFYLGKVDNGRSVELTIKNMLSKTTLEPKPKTISEQVLEIFRVDWFKAYEAHKAGQLPQQLQKPFDAYELTPETATQFDIGYDKNSDRITIPIRNASGELVSIKARAAQTDDYPKYLGLGDTATQARYGFDRINDDSLVFGLDTAEPELILCEGEFDAISMRQKGFKGAVAIGTCEATEAQVRQIIKKAIRATILFDADEAGIKGANKLAHLLLPHMPVRIAKLDQNDPAVTSKDNLETIIKNAKLPKETKE
jgi:DNA primase